MSFAHRSFPWALFALVVASLLWSDPAHAAGSTRIDQLSVSGSGYYNCAVTEAGAVKCWGRNFSGQLGDGTTLSSGVPVQVSGLTTNAKSISTGFNHTCAVMDSGSLKCWGSNANDKLGNDSMGYSTVPVDVPGISSAKAVATARSNTCALLASGSIRCWGAGWRNMPLITGITEAQAIAAGRRLYCALAASGQVKCWNYSEGPRTVRNINDATAIAVGTSNNACAISSAGKVNCWSFYYDTTPTPGINNAVDIALSRGRMCVATAAGAVKCMSIPIWGDTSPARVPGLMNAVAVDVGPHHACALTATGGVKCWGINTLGQLGNGHLPQAIAPVQPRDLAGPVASIAVGDSHVCSLSTTGKAQCWGQNVSGQLGDGTRTDRSSPVPVSGVVPGFLTRISPGWRHTCAVTVTGGVQCWGRNEHGQLGDGTTIDRLTPVTVDLPAGVYIKAVAAGDDHSCALAIAGQVLCWGSNSDGQLGNGTNLDSSSPVPVTGLSDIEVIAITAAYKSTCALTAAGQVKCWGLNSYGQLGNGNTTSSTTPVNVIGLTQATALDTGSASACVATADGQVKCWGAGGATAIQIDSGGFPATVTVPETMTGVEDAVAVAVGRSHHCVLTSMGKVKCWGQNLFGQLGDGNYSSSAVPVPVTGLSGPVKAISTRLATTCALTIAGTVACWGSNNAGQLGIGGPLDSEVPVSVIGFGRWDGIFANGFDRAPAS